VGVAFERIRLDVLQRQRDPKALAQAVLEMRQRMREAHPNPSDAFDLKHDRDGMVDIEFAVQFLVLAHAATYPSLCENLGNIALLARAASLGLIPATIAAAAQDAYRTYRRRQHQLRMNGARYARVPPEQVSDHRAAAHALWQYVFKTT
jgi:glutamate-ammonia-ligase adenylyltransferase